MKPLPLNIGTLHFVGIGGIGMSGIAEVLHNLGYAVQGSNNVINGNAERLQNMGVPVHIGHSPDFLTDAKGQPVGAVVLSSAIQPDNPEVVAARQRRIPVVHRADMLAELMRLKYAVAIAGTHGKTTTTSLVGALLEAGDFDPTVINGGIINAYGTNTRLGAGDWFVAEADESDGSFTRLPATVGVITNIDPEHMEHYGSFEALREAFRQFAENLPFYGFCVLCIDHKQVQALIPELSAHRLITYGLSPQADVRAKNIRYTPEGSYFDVSYKTPLMAKRKEMKGLFVTLVGQHNVGNALAAISVALKLGVSETQIKTALKLFRGVKRRFTTTGVVNGIRIIDDYGHHPVEIAATLRAARQTLSNGEKIIAVMQPHRYSRLRDHFTEFCQCFNDADIVIVSDVYEAGELPIEGINRDTLVEGLRHHGHNLALPLESHQVLASLIAEYAEPQDMVICLGAGSISQWAQNLPAELQDLQSHHVPEGKARGMMGNMLN